MYPAGRQPGLGVLPVGTDQGRRPGVDGPDGPSVFEDPLLRLQEDEGLAAATGLSGEPKKGSKADAVDGSGSHLPASQHQQPAPGHRIVVAELLEQDSVWSARSSVMARSRALSCSIRAFNVGRSWPCTRSGRLCPRQPSRAILRQLPSRSCPGPSTQCCRSDR